MDRVFYDSNANLTGCWQEDLQARYEWTFLNSSLALLIFADRRDKLGTLIGLDGSAEYRVVMINIAVRAGIRVDFNDADLDRRYVEGIEATDGRRNL